MGKITELVEKYKIDEIKYDFSGKDNEPISNDRGKSLTFPNIGDEQTAEFVLKKLKVQWNQKIPVDAAGEELEFDFEGKDLVSSTFTSFHGLTDVEYRNRSRIVAEWNENNEELKVQQKAIGIKVKGGK